MSALAFFSAFVLAFLGSIPIAGPIALLVFERALAGRFKSALLIAYGGGLVEGIYAGVAAAGLGALLTRYPNLRSFSHAFTGVALVAVGIYFFLHQPKAEVRQPVRFEGRASFLLGASVTALNPTLLATWTGSLSLIFAVTGASFTVAQAPWFGIGATAGILVWFTLATTLVRRYQVKLEPHRLRLILRVVGLILVVVGLVDIAYAAHKALTD